MNTKTSYADNNESKAKKIPAMFARRHFGEIINKVFFQKEKYIIERDRKPLALLMPLEEYESLKKYSGIKPFLKIHFKEDKSLSKKVDKIVYGT